MQDYNTSFIGNSIYGGQNGVEGSANNSPPYTYYSYNCSGNSFTLYPTFDVQTTYDDPGFAAEAAGCQTASVCGNTLFAGCLGFYFTGASTNALVLNNNFGAASYRGIGYALSGDSLNSAQIFGNTLCEGVSFHVQLHYVDSFGWFLGNNTNVNTNSIVVPLFTDPAATAIHIFN
jgi:hypothetical protein